MQDHKRQKTASNLDRRQFLSHSLGLPMMASLPAGLLSDQGFGQLIQSSPKTKNLIVITYPNGAILRKWHPIVGQIPHDQKLTGKRTPAKPYMFGKGDTLSFALDPLKDHAENLVALRGLNTLGHGGSSSHPEAASQVLSGGNRNQDSFESVIASALSSSLEKKVGLNYLGLFNRYNLGKDYLMFRSNGGQPVLPEDDPTRAANLLFGSKEKSIAKEIPIESELLVLQNTIQSVEQKLKCCSRDSAVHFKLTTHLESLKALEESLQNPILGDNCKPTNLIGMTDSMRDNNINAEKIVRSQWNVIAGALKCNISQVFGFSFMAAQDESLFINFDSIAELLDQSDGGGFGSERRWWNQNRSHSSSHEANGVFAVQTRWYNMMIAELVTLLKSTKTQGGTGNLFDETLICVVSENGESSYHGQEDVGWYMLGGAKTPLGPGRVQDCGGKGGSDLFLEIARMMGLNWNYFARSSGGISGLNMLTT